jgi:DNA polymerase III subunit epsilon
MELVTIDLETANETRASVCSCGIAVVADGKVVDKRHWLIQPKELRFNPYNVRIHGIDRDAVADQPRLCELWEEIRPYLDSRIVLAHNARFDMSVLRNSLDGYEIDYPQLEYSCTYLISRQTWKDWVCFALSAVAYKLNIDFSHHDAA